MSSIKSLNQLIGFNKDFKTAINLYLSLNKKEKIKGYIPTKSSIAVLKDYLEAVVKNKEQATLLIGSYGKGKSHLLLVLLAVLTMDRNNTKNKEIIDELVEKISKIEGPDNYVCEMISELWKIRGRFLPILVQDNNSDLQQDFIIAINDALRREHIDELIPNTAFDVAVERINDWRENFLPTYKEFIIKIQEKGYLEDDYIDALNHYSREELDIFIDLYPQITSGSDFNPLVTTDVLNLFRGVSERLKEDYGYSGIYIVFDEFSKFIEGQNPEFIGKNMKLIQNICELATESKESQIFMTLIAHKSIKEYGKYLPIEVINLFTGIEGRLIEKYFITSTKNNYELISNAIIKDYNILADCKKTQKYISKERCEEFYNIPCFKSVFNKGDFERIILKGCYPLSPISAYLLLNVSEKVAQNERTLFTFISNDEPFSMTRFVQEHTDKESWIVGADLIYDYFSGLFKKEINNEFVHSEWLNAEYALSKCENEDQRKIVKSMAVILIVNKNEEFPVIDDFLKLSVEISDYPSVINVLLYKNIIYKKGIDGSYAFKTRAGSELKKEIKNRRTIKGTNINYASVFSKIIQKPYYFPRKFNSIHKMTRFFRNEFMDVESFINLDEDRVLFEDMPFCDGVVLSLFSIKKINEGDIRRKLRTLCNNKIVVICPQKEFLKQKQTLDYEIIQELKHDIFIEENQVMSKELPLQEEELGKEIELEIEEMYSGNCKVLYRLPGDKNLRAVSYNECEDIIGNLCEKIYNRTPIINNEIINRENILTGPTKKARNIITKTILEHRDDEKFYSGSNQEATIARALIHNTKLEEDNSCNPISDIVKYIDGFLDSCCDRKLNMKSLISYITSEPYGMRKGPLPIYLSYVIAKRHEDIIVYFNNIEVQLNEEILVNMCENPSDYELFISKDDAEKEKYISELNELFDVKNSLNLTENRIRNIIICMQRRFRALPQVTRNLPYLDEFDVVDDLVKSLMKIYKKLIQRVSPNPYQFLFMELPEMFNCYDGLSKTFELLSQVITAFDDYRDWIILKASNGTKDIFTKKNKEDLVYILKRWYDEQSLMAKHELLDRRATNFMSCIKTLNVYSDEEVVSYLVKAVTDVFIENWNVGAYEEYITELQHCKALVESIKDGNIDGKLQLTYYNSSGEQEKLYYEQTHEGQSNILKNILEDTLEEYSDLSVNDRVAILVELIDKIVRK